MLQTLNSYLDSYAQENGISSSLVSVIQSIVQACICISGKVHLGDLSGILGEAGTGNIQGEQQKKLDVIANSILIDYLSKNEFVAGLASEEEDSFIEVDSPKEYLVLFDPLDGSSNIDVNISIGTIFSVLKKTKGPLTEQDFLQAGKHQVVAGYVLYGPQTILVLTFGQKVFMFTLDQDNNFIISPRKIVIASSTQEFAINVSNYRFWEYEIREYINLLLQGDTGARAKNYNMRWVASMVAEVHRILIRSGVFLYPKDSRKGTQEGKLRLLYEANPMSFIVEAAGGQASDMHQNILDIQPAKLHQRVPVLLGSSEEIEFVQKLYANIQGAIK